MNYVDFEFGKKSLVFWNKDKVSLLSFVDKKTNREIRYFRKIINDGSDPKIISRSAFGLFREPFEIEPWNKILIDTANEYGTKVDKNKEAYLKNALKDESEVMLETKLSIVKMKKYGFVWVGRSQMVCHPDSLIYGEIDEIWYKEDEDTFYVGDTKTASSVRKVTYWYQLGIYIEILRALNPGKKISSIGVIDWVKIKDKKWTVNRGFNENDWTSWIGNKDISKDDPVYNAKWTQVPLTPIETTNNIVYKDLEEVGVLEQVKNDLNFIKKYKIASSADFAKKLEENFSDIERENNNLQTNYDVLKTKLHNS